MTDRDEKTNHRTDRNPKSIGRKWLSRGHVDDFARAYYAKTTLPYDAAVSFPRRSTDRADPRNDSCLPPVRFRCRHHNAHRADRTQTSNTMCIAPHTPTTATAPLASFAVVAPPKRIDAHVDDARCVPVPTRALDAGI